MTAHCSSIFVQKLLLTSSSGVFGCLLAIEQDRMSSCGDRCSGNSGKYSPEMPKEASPATGFETGTQTGRQSGGQVNDKAREASECPQTCKCNPCNCNPCNC